jgi:hypothetical protein
MKDYKGKIIGILGTVIFHLVAAIFFMLFQIHSLNIDLSNEFVIEFAEESPDNLKDKERLIELPAKGMEQVLQGDEDLLNIARNLANKPDVQIDPEDYINKVKDELIKSGKLGVDNYIDEWKRLKEAAKDEKLAYENRTGEKEEEEPLESEVMAANYQGPTRIYYNLEGRNHTYLPIPIYKCEGSGKIVLAILVNQKGIVEEARIIETESTTIDPCLEDTAVNTALISRFNPDIYSPKIQAGTLTYHFVAQ